MLKFLGRGCCFNPMEGYTSAFYKKEDKLLLIDVGGNIFERIYQKNILDDVTECYIVITHCHCDHIGSLSDLIHYCYYAKKINVNIIPANHSLQKEIKTILENLYTIDNEYCFYDNFILTQLNISICFVPTNHYAAMSSYGVIIKKLHDDNNRIFYTGDISSFPNEILKDLHKYEKIYTDVALSINPAHIHVEDLMKIIPKEHLHKIYCMHIEENTEKLLKNKYHLNVVTLD